MIREFQKAIKVIESCETIQQLDVATNYVSLFKKHSVIGLPKNLYSEIVNRQVSRMYVELCELIQCKKFDLTGSKKDYSDQL